MTAAEQNHNYMANMARISGYWKGTANIVLDNVQYIGSTEYIANTLRRTIELTDKWFEHRYEGPFMADDIENMLAEERANDIVELERA